jgi:Ni,Fe-hydrogenase I cytochrome b subunit
MWFFLAFVIVHVIGVFTAENLGDPGIVSAMINGGRSSSRD